MKERSFDEMVAYFNHRVSEMDIAQDYKMELLGMVTALGYKHEKTAQPEPIKINFEDFNKEDWERFKKEWGNTPITVLPAQPEIVRCKDCKHFHYDMPYLIQGVPILGHEVCDFWGDGCKTSENGFCSYAERREE